MDATTQLSVHQIHPSDREWLEQLLREHWGGPTVVARGRVHVASQLDGAIATIGTRRTGAITWLVEGDSCEVVTLNSLQSGLGVGSALVRASTHAARASQCRRLWLITTNDNLSAIRFYQRRGFELVAVHRRAIERSRQLKPSIPLVGDHGIPIRDEIELEIDLTVK